MVSTVNPPDRHLGMIAALALSLSKNVATTTPTSAVRVSGRASRHA
jgi:hypothetical protein